MVRAVSPHRPSFHCPKQLTIHVPHIICPPPTHTFIHRIDPFIDTHTHSSISSTHSSTHPSQHIHPSHQPSTFINTPPHTHSSTHTHLHLQAPLVLIVSSALDLPAAPWDSSVEWVAEPSSAVPVSPPTLPRPGGRTRWVSCLLRLASLNHRHSRLFLLTSGGQAQN